MGAASSVVDIERIDKVRALELAGSKFDEAAFDAVAVDGFVSVTQWNDAVSKSSSTQNVIL